MELALFPVGPTSASHPSGAANHSPSHPPNGSANDLAVRSGITCARIHGVDMHCVDDVYRRCRDLGMRLSRQRKMVLSLLWDSQDHLSARDIYEQLNDMGRNIGHTSVYQNLEALQSAGVIECLDRANGRLYGYRADPHSHLTCVDTGEIQDLDVELPPDLLRRIGSHDFHDGPAFSSTCFNTPILSCT